MEMDWDRGQKQGSNLSLILVNFKTSARTKSDMNWVISIGIQN